MDQVLGPTIRPANSGRLQDVVGITRIYNDAVLHTTAIWNNTVADESNRRAWIGERNAQGFPVLIAVENDEVLGYATFGPFRPHDGYRHTAKNSIYVRSDQRRRGIAGIEAENMASIRLNEHFGFHEVGRLPEGGKNSTDGSIVFMQKTIEP